MAPMEEVSTLYVGGLPIDCPDRELDNLCRFLPGFVCSKADRRKGLTLFVLFDSSYNAKAAIQAMNFQHFDRSNPVGEPLRVTMAKSNMRQTEPTGPSWGLASAMGGAYQQTKIQRFQPTAEGYPSKRPRMSESPGDVDTVAIMGAKEAGHDEESLERVFAGMPHFVAFKGNARLGGGFAKFETPQDANAAIAAAQAQGIPASLAKSSMVSTEQGGSQSYAPRQPMQLQDYPIVPTSKQDGIDTLACMGARDAGYDEDTLNQFFSPLAGFITMKWNARMGGAFVKFASPGMAAEALAVAQEQGFPATMAKNSMGSVR